MLLTEKLGPNDPPRLIAVTMVAKSSRKQHLRLLLLVLLLSLLLLLGSETLILIPWFPISWGI